MTSRVKKHAKTLRILAQCDKHTANSIIKGANPDLIACISDVCHNTLQGKVKLSDKAKKRLSRYKKSIRKIASKSATLKTKKRLLQTGHGLLSSILIPLLGSVIGPIFKTLTK